MGRVDIYLRYVTNTIATCVVLHNMCTFSKDTFDKE